MMFACPGKTEVTTTSGVLAGVERAEFVARL